MRNRIIGALRSSSDPTVTSAAGKVAQNIVFEYPSIKQLSAHIVRLLSGADAQPVEATLAIERMIKKYSIGLAGSEGQQLAPTLTPAPISVVLLTGSTGNLGSFLLEALLRDAEVERIYAYNRPARDADVVTSKDRQRSAFIDKGFELELLESDRLVYLEGDGALPKLGLTDEVYEQVSCE